MVRTEQAAFDNYQEGRYFLEGQGPASRQGLALPDFAGNPRIGGAPQDGEELPGPFLNALQSSAAVCSLIWCNWQLIHGLPGKEATDDECSAWTTASA